MILAKIFNKNEFKYLKKMKKKIVSIVFVAAIAVAAAWNFSQSKAEADMPDLALANVEALASGEGSTTCSSCNFNSSSICWMTPFDGCLGTRRVIV
jgi:hypothetical protein